MGFVKGILEGSKEHLLAALDELVIPGLRVEEQAPWQQEAQILMEKTQEYLNHAPFSTKSMSIIFQQKSRKHDISKVEVKRKANTDKKIIDFVYLTRYALLTKVTRVSPSVAVPVNEWGIHVAS